MRELLLLDGSSPAGEFFSMFIAQPIFILMTLRFLFCLLLFLLKLSYTDAFYWFSFFRMFYRTERQSEVPKVCLNTVMEWNVSNQNSYVYWSPDSHCDNIWRWGLWKAMARIMSWEWSDVINVFMKKGEALELSL